MEEKDDNIYRKVGDHYEAIGICEPVNVLYDGVWYIRHRDHCKSTTSTDYMESVMRIGPSVKPDLCQLAGLQDYVDDILASRCLVELRDKGYSMYDLVSVIVGKVFELNDKYRKNKPSNEEN